MTSQLDTTQKDNLLKTLKSRFEKNIRRHPNIKWEQVEKKINAANEKLTALWQMEDTGGEPDVVEFPEMKGKIAFCDCSAESPKGRRSLCYDDAALKARKEHKPKNSALTMAQEMGIQMLDETQYRFLQSLEKFDQKTSSWIITPAPIRQLDGALFCDNRYDHVFTYHNGAVSYYAARGFRGLLLL